MNNSTVEVEIDLEEFEKDLLIYLIKFSHEKNLTFNEALVYLLTSFIENQDAKN